MFVSGGRNVKLAASSLTSTIIHYAHKGVLLGFTTLREVNLETHYTVHHTTAVRGTLACLLALHTLVAYFVSV